MNNEYIKPEVEIVEFSVEEIAVGEINPSMGTTDGEDMGN